MAKKMKLRNKQFPKVRLVKTGGYAIPQVSSGYFVVGKKYAIDYLEDDVSPTFGRAFTLVDNNQFCLEFDCAWLDGGDWSVVEASYQLQPL